MSNTILIKRSAVANAVPTTANLSLGELAINTYDGRLFTKIDDGTPAVVDLTENQTITLSGDATGSGQTAITVTLASSQPNITSIGTLTSISVTGNVQGGNLLTGGLISSTGNLTSANINTGGVVTATGNIAGNNISAAGFVSATGNVTGLNINTAKVASTGGITIQSGGSSDLTLDSAGNINADNNYINNVGYPQQNADAASKLYVDNMVATGLTYHEAVVAATTANLATTTGGTISYSQPNGAGNGVGATITTTGSFDLIDTANVQAANTRILVKNEGNAVLNGVYYWANATAIIRTTDTDEYGPNSIDQLSYNDYFFVSSGNVNKGSAWVVDAPTDTITFGNSNISFAQFSSSQTYTANTQAGIVINGTVFSAQVDNDTTAFDGGGNIIVKAGANLVTPNIGAATGTSLSATGTVTGGNLATSGTVSATGNITGGNLSGTNIEGTLTTASQTNITAVGTLSSLSVTGNVDAGNVSGTNIAGTLTTGSQTNITAVGTLSSLSVTGNVNAGNVSGTNGEFTNISGTLTTNAQPNITSVGTLSSLSVTGNVDSGNLITLGFVSATGNVSGNYFIGNGSLLTGITTGSSSSIANGTSNVSIAVADGNVTVGVAGVSNIAVFSASGLSVTGNIYGTDVFKNGVTVLTANDTVDGGTY